MHRIMAKCVTRRSPKSLHWDLRLLSLLTPLIQLLVTGALPLTNRDRVEFLKISLLKAPKYTN